MSSGAGAATGGDRRAHAEGWRLAWYALTAAFLLSAALNLLRVRGGFLTSHLADLVVPAWLYVHVRGLSPSAPPRLLHRLVGATPRRAAALLLAASAATELSQAVWPRGAFAGTFDPLDIVAYGAGLAACLAAELVTGTATVPRRPTAGAAQE
jgi:hypothetical protein